ncbi:hypothetical protein J6590_079152 [Homalodisca vitripennis]|nr:hypothetical protein J6590_079152 [Homalodisca vitripennis]
MWKSKGKDSCHVSKSRNGIAIKRYEGGVPNSSSNHPLGFLASGFIIHVGYGEARGMVESVYLFSTSTGGSIHHLFTDFFNIEDTRTFLFLRAHRL